MANECRNGDQGHRAIIQAKGWAIQLDQQHGEVTFERVKQQGGDGRFFVARAQNVGGAWVLAAVGAWVIQAHHTAHDDSEGQRAHQVAAHGQQHND